MKVLKADEQKAIQDQGWTLGKITRSKPNEENIL